METEIRKLGEADGKGFPYGMKQDLRNPGFSGGLESIPVEDIRGIAKKRYRCFELELDNARVNERFRLNATLIQIVKGYDTANSVPDATVEIRVRFNDQDADEVPMFPGQSIGGIPFDDLYISHDAQADKTITILCITDSAEDRVDVE